jgi:hypothetical protein
MGLRCRTAVSATVLFSIFATYRYSRIVIRVFRLPDEDSVRPMPPRRRGQPFHARAPRSPVRATPSRRGVGNQYTR